jgi:dolichyl-phosphate-mannose--protein O-mannosyl transferase
MSTSSARLDAGPGRGETGGEQNRGERLYAMGTPADFWIVLAAIAAWSAIVLVVALFADRTARDG